MDTIQRILECHHLVPYDENSGFFFGFKCYRMDDMTLLYITIHGNLVLFASLFGTLHKQNVGEQLATLFQSNLYLRR